MQVQCTKCGEVKPQSEFGRASHRRSGFDPQCKACNASVLKAWRRANPEKRAAQNRRARPNAEQRRATYQRTRKDRTEQHRRWYAANREDQVAYAVRTTKQWRREHPAEQRLLSRAWYEVARAIRNGTLIRPDSCEECLASGVPIQAAHYDYHEPLRVRWLCRSCHSQWDLAEPKLQLTFAARPDQSDAQTR